jgi:hypothetical protein
MRFETRRDGTIYVTFNVSADELSRFMSRLLAAWEAVTPAAEPIETAPTEPPPEEVVTAEQLAIAVEPPTGGVLPVLSAVDGTWRTCLEIAKRCSLDGKTVGHELKALVKAGSIEAQGASRGKRYRLVAAE